MAQKERRELDTTELVPAKSIVAQTWAWRSFDKLVRGPSQSVVFDNVEVSDNMGKRNAHVLLKFYFLLSARLVRHSSKDNPIEAVLVGVGPYGQQGLSYKGVGAYPESLISSAGKEKYAGYSDATEQGVVFDENVSEYVGWLEDFETHFKTLEKEDCSPEFLTMLCARVRFFSLDEARKLISLIGSKKQTDKGILI